MPDITGSKPVNNAVISTNIKILVGNWTVGYIRNITETQARPTTAQYEVGSVGPIDMVPNQPAAVTIACTKVAVYGANLINVIANALNSDLGGIEAAPGLTQAETVSAMQYWLGQRQGKAGADGDFTDIFSLNDLPVGFVIEVDETFPVPGSDGSLQTMITYYHNCWIVSYTRPIISTGDLLVAETANINSQYVSYQKGRQITAGSVEVVS